MTRTCYDTYLSLVIPCHTYLSYSLSYCPLSYPCHTLSLVILSLVILCPLSYFKESEEGEGLLNELNASFLIEISFSIIGMLFTISVLLIAGMGFTIDEYYATIVNTIVLFILLFICFAVIWWLIYIAKNLHNIAKFTILYERIESKNK